MNYFSRLNERFRLAKCSIEFYNFLYRSGLFYLNLWNTFHFLRIHVSSGVKRIKMTSFAAGRVKNFTREFSKSEKFAQNKVFSIE